MQNKNTGTQEMSWRPQLLRPSNNSENSSIPTHMYTQSDMFASTKTHHRESVISLEMKLIAIPIESVDNDIAT